MKLLGITQRADIANSYGERRDCLDQRWFELIYSLGLVPVPLPNVSINRIEQLLDGLNISAILFSGGNSLASLGTRASDLAPERDQFEFALFEWALNLSIPVLGVCRGMQLINYCLGGKLKAVPSHTSVRHVVKFVGALSSEANREVNSYHNWGLSNVELAKNLQPLAEADDGVIEAFQHNSKKIAGIMWHPEREPQTHPQDIRLMKNFLL